MVGVVRGLGEPVRVDELDPGLGREPALRQLLLQGLPCCRHAPQVRQLTGVLLQVGHDDLEVGRHDLEGADPAFDDRVDEPLDVEDHLLLDEQGPPADQQRGHQLPQRDVEALRRDLRDHLPLGDLKVVDLCVEVVEHPGVLAHRTLRLAGGPGGEVDVGQLVRRDRDAEIVLDVVLRVGLVDEERPHPGDRVEGLVQRGGAAGFGQHELTPGTRQRGRDAVRREVRLDGQIHPTGLEDRQDGGHPVQVPLGHHRDHTLAAQPARQQRPPQPVGVRVELPVGPLPVTVHRCDRVRVHPHPLLEQLVEPPVRQLPARPGQPFELEPQLLGRQQARPSVLGVRVGGHQCERGEVVAGDPPRAVRVERVGAIPQAQHQSVAGVRDAHPQHGVLAEIAGVAGGIEHGLERRPGQVQLTPQIVDRELLV